MSSYEWAREQLDRVSLDEATSANVMSLILAWERRDTGSDEERVLSIFGDLARGIAIETTTEDQDFTWAPATKAKPRQHDVVRVRRDAFDSGPSRVLNGKVGIVARISRGTLVIAFDQGTTSAHLHPDKLEAQVPKV